MLPNTELICELGSGASLCNAGAWHAIFVTQTLLVLTLALTNALMGVRHRRGLLAVPARVGRVFSKATMLAGVVPLFTGLWLRQKVKVASFDCYLEHGLSGCDHSLVDRALEMQQVSVWVGWVEAVLISASVFGLILLKER